MTERERKIAVLLTSILQGNLTVSQLRRLVQDGKTRIKRLGANRVEQRTREAISIGEETLARIEREKVRYDRQRNN